MSLVISLIPYGHISYAIPSLLGNLQKSELWTKGRANVDDIVKFVITGQMQLWVAFDKDTNIIHGYYITEVKQYPQQKMLVVQYCAGDTGILNQTLLESTNLINKFALDNDCAGIEVFGRPGWMPHARKHGYTTQTVVYEKYFDEVKS